MKDTVNASGSSTNQDLARKLHDVTSNDSERVLKSRFLLGSDDGAYLRQGVVPLQTSGHDQDACDESYDLGPSNDPFTSMQQRSRITIIQAAIAAHNESIKTHSNEIKMHSKLIAYMLSIQEVREFVQAVLESQNKTKPLRTMRLFANSPVKASEELERLATTGNYNEVDQLKDIALAMSLLFEGPSNFVDEQIQTSVYEQAAALSDSINNLAVQLRQSYETYQNEVSYPL